MLSIYKRILALIFLINKSYAITTEPCNILDTVNITGSMKFINGSYLHDGIMYPPNLVGMYNYIAINTTTNQSTESHLRGCLCKMKSCVNICCPRSHFFKHSVRKCLEANRPIYTDIEFRRNDNSHVTIDLYDVFEPIIRKPCYSGYPLEPNIYPEDEWVIFENGTILLEDTNSTFSRNQYCLQRLSLENKTYNVFSPYICVVPTPRDLKFDIYSIILFLSLPFLIITILVYIILPELRNLHGKSFVCYLIGLTIGNLLLACAAIFVFPTKLCISMGYLIYFFYMGSFFWLNVISFDVWWSFHNTKGSSKYDERKWFILYSLYAWGWAALFLVIVIVAQYSNLPKHLKPGIDGTRCFLNTELWIQFAYFHGPILLIILANLIMFIMTALKIYKVQKEISHTMSRDGNKRNLHEEKKKFGLFLRLFIVMGITWLLEIVSWFVGSGYDAIFYVSDVCNALQGLIIFILFVLKKRVKKLIIKRYRSMRGIPTTSSRTNSSNTHTTSANNQGEDIGLETRLNKN